MIVWPAVLCFITWGLWAQGRENLEKKIVGKWCNPYTYQSSGELKGFEFKKDGRCVAINIPSLDLKTWKIRNDTLVIQGYEVQEDGKKVPYETEERIELLTRDSLSLVTQEANPRLVFLYLNVNSIKEKVNFEGK